MIELNGVVILFTAVYLGQTLFSFWIEWLNLRHLREHGGQVPAPFEDAIDPTKLSEIAAYTVAKSRVALLQDVLSEFLLLGLILFGALTALARFLDGWDLNFYLAALLFFAGPAILQYILDLPFDYYHAFVVEEAFGFNRRTFRLWVIDHLKSGLISSLLFGALFFTVLWIIRVSPEWWWFWGFLTVSAVQLVLVGIYPVLIAPLFNTFEPVRDEELSDRIQRLMEDNGFRVKKILQMNAGIRSRHTNAYFTGIGRTKQIVLFDTLLESHTYDEIISVLAHEVGHFKGRHILKQILFFELSLLAGFYATYLVLNWPGLFTAFGFEPYMTYAGLFILSIFWQKAGFFVQPLYMAVSRKFEREADVFATRLIRTSRHLIAALKRLAADNLSNLTPHPLYVRFHYSHPPLVERIALLEEADRAVNCRAFSSQSPAESDR